MKAPFTPTKPMLEALENYLIAKAWNETVKPIFENLEREILEAGDYQCALLPDKYKNNPDVMKNWPTGRITNPKHVHTMAGIREGIDSEEGKNMDAARYYSELDRRAKNAGLIHGMNAGAVADHNVIKANWALVQAMEPVTGIPLDTATRNLSNYRKLTDLTLNLLVPFLHQGPDFQMKQRKYYSEHCNHLTPAWLEATNQVQANNN